MQMNELLPHLITGASVIFGFGWQSSDMRTAKRDVKNIANSHREIIDKLSKLDATLARIDQRLLHLESKSN